MSHIQSLVRETFSIVVCGCDFVFVERLMHTDRETFTIIVVCGCVILFVLLSV